MTPINNLGDVFSHMADKLQQATQKVIKSVPLGCCPRCGTNRCRHDYYSVDPDTLKTENLGWFSEWTRSDIEPGDYTCINGHQFTVRVVDEKGTIEIK